MKSALVITLNCAIAATILVLFVEGYGARVFADQTYMTHGIAALGVVSVALSLWWYAVPGDPVRAVHWLGYLSVVLVELGLIGTVVGFVIAMQGVSATGAADVTGIGPMVTALLSGMGTALFTTLVGSVAALWIKVNRQFIAARG